MSPLSLYIIHFGISLLIVSNHLKYSTLRYFLSVLSLRRDILRTLCDLHSSHWPRNLLLTGFPHAFLHFILSPLPYFIVMTWVLLGKLNICSHCPRREWYMYSHGGFSVQTDTPWMLTCSRRWHVVVEQVGKSILYCGSCRNVITVTYIWLWWC